MRKQSIAAVVVAGVGIATVSFGQQPAGQEVVSTPQIHTEVESGTTTVGLQSFMDFGHISNQADGTDIAPTGTGFDVKRFYLIVDHKFDDVWAANLTTDAEYLADKTTSITVPPVTKGTTVVTSGGSGGVTEVFIKKLYLQATLNDAFVVHAGAYTSPWAPFLVRALELSADDYLTKPYSPRTLIARVKALPRRAGTDGGYKSEAGPYRLDASTLELHVDGLTHRITPLESRLLQLLIANAGQPVPTDRLLTHVWGRRAGGDRQLLKQLVHRLRQKLGDSGTAGHALETVANVGYRLRV